MGQGWFAKIDVEMEEQLRKKNEAYVALVADHFLREQLARFHV